jgi:DNA-binding response OmpR family regulator
MVPGPRHILLVDDDEAVCSGLALAIGDAGWLVTSASTLLEAMLRILECPPEVLVLDVHLGPVDGLAMVPRLRALGPRTRILAITGQPGAAVDAGVRMAGIHGLLVKPFPAESLERSLTAAWQDAPTETGPRVRPVPCEELQALILDISASGADVRPVVLERIRALADLQGCRDIEALAFATRLALDDGPDTLAAGGPVHAALGRLRAMARLRA